MRGHRVWTAVPATLAITLLLPLTPVRAASGPMTAHDISPEGSHPWEITAGPDGGLWFTGDGMVGRITTAGLVIEYPLLPPLAYSAGITVGPDGALWFTATALIGGLAQVRSRRRRPAPA